MQHTLEPIGYIRSPYQQKFSVPRQPSLVTATTSSVEFVAPFNQPEMLDEIEQFSHFWLIFAFHQNIKAGWKPKVRPPRLGGNKKVGVLASRSSFRPNHLGLSLMELSRVERNSGQPVLQFKGGDLVNGTPIYDIKPYLPYADSVSHANAGYAQSAPQSQLAVFWSEQASQQALMLKLSEPQYGVINQVLAQDPRPAYKQQQQDNKEYGVALYHFNIRWRIKLDQQQIPFIEIVAISHAAQP
ncbi:tRNA (N6-threonylcarbamoyladenosine(37)-N6)-methyltransferase TrmO [Agarivorans sp.]|uniref:tRNA (N6-threonylcarbamoyladenosine(37)-N6)-methyltransferase TrmO n=1 Tax=Agarivorans sp. TaxID=1872412 RepID=UPI003D072F4F